MKQLHKFALPTGICCTKVVIRPETRVAKGVEWPRNKNKGPLEASCFPTILALVSHGVSRHSWRPGKAMSKTDTCKGNLNRLTAVGNERVTTCPEASVDVVTATYPPALTGIPFGALRATLTIRTPTMTPVTTKPMIVTTITNKWRRMKFRRIGACLSSNMWGSMTPSSSFSRVAPSSSSFPARTLSGVSTESRSWDERMEECYWVGL